VPVPAASDIAFTATVAAQRLRFEEQPDARVEFSGGPGRTSVSASERTRLPEHVEEGVEYRDARVRYILATRLRTDDDGGGGSGEHRDTLVHREPDENGGADEDDGADEPPADR